MLDIRIYIFLLEFTYPNLKEKFVRLEKFIHLQVALILRIRIRELYFLGKYLKIYTFI